MDSYFLSQNESDKFSMGSNQIRRRKNQNDRLDFENNGPNSPYRNEFQSIGYVSDTLEHHAQMQNNESNISNCMIYSNSHHTNNPHLSKSGSFLSNLSHLKISGLKKAGKVCAKTIKKKINSIVQSPEYQKSLSKHISTKDAINAMDSGPIRSHHEFGILTETLLAWGGGVYLTQFGSIKDFAELSPQSFFENQIINQHIAIRLVDYMCDLPECKKFTVKYINWKLKYSKIPEEYILSVEYLGFCIKNLGAGFPGFISKSLMRTLGKMLKFTTFKHSLAQDVKKQISKIISGSSCHPGIATDPRIHALKSKILFTIQLCHDAFLMQQALYPDFFLEYRRMRAKGIRFPRIPPGSRYMIKDVELITSYCELNLPIDMKVLEEISTTIERISKGENDEKLMAMLAAGKGKILESINTLSEMNIQEFNEISFIKANNILYEDFMDKLFKLNDSIDELLSNPLGVPDLLQFDSNDEDEGDEKMEKELAEIFSMTYNSYEHQISKHSSTCEYSSQMLSNDDAWSASRDDTGALDEPTNLSLYEKKSIGVSNYSDCITPLPSEPIDSVDPLKLVENDNSETRENFNESKNKSEDNKLNFDDILKTLDEMQNEL